MHAQPSPWGSPPLVTEDVGRAIDAAAALLGGREELAKALGLKRPSAIGNWKSRGVPMEYCPRIELLTNRKITRRDLRPGDFHVLWPELAPDYVAGAHPLFPELDRPASAVNGG